MLNNIKHKELKINQWKAAWAFVERQFNLCKRYIGWEIVFLFYTIVNTLTIGLIAVGMQQQGKPIESEYIIYLIIGALIWGYLSIIFHEVAESIAWERWEGTIEYTFMAPILRITHLGGVCIYAIIYGILRSSIILIIAVAFFGIKLENANYLGALMVLLASSVSFLGLGFVAAVLPLLSPEKGAQATHIMEGVLLLVSGIYYPVTALPEWLQPFSVLSPATYTLEGIRTAILHGTPTVELLPLVFKTLFIGILLVPIGLVIFNISERYAKRAGLLKRSG